MRYCGSKARYIKELLPILTEHLSVGTFFYDAFMGGANVLSEIDTPNKVGIEINKYVVAMWQNIQDCKLNGLGHPSFLSPTRKPVDKDEYEKVKNDYLRETGIFKPHYIGYVGTCCTYGSGWFNGFANFNRKRNENHIEESRKNLVKHIDRFKYLGSTRFVNGSYDTYQYKPHSIIYCDPPYKGRKKYNNKDFDHERFWNWVRTMSKLGHHVYVSEYTAPSDFKVVWEKIKKDGMGTTKTGCKQQENIERLFVLK